jgi:hypothetical protein
MQDVRIVCLLPGFIVAQTWGTAAKVKPNTTILHSEADSRELLNNSGLPSEVLIVVGTEHRLADDESLATMVWAVERTKKQLYKGSSK